MVIESNFSDCFDIEWLVITKGELERKTSSIISVDSVLSQIERDHGGVQARREHGIGGEVSADFDAFRTLVVAESGKREEGGQEVMASTEQRRQEKDRTVELLWRCAGKGWRYTPTEEDCLLRYSS